MNHPSEFAVDKVTDDIIFNLKHININDLCYLLVQLNKEKAEELFQGLKRQLNENNENNFVVKGQPIKFDTEIKYEFIGIENAVRGWAAMSGHRNDQEKYAKLSESMK